MANIVAGKKSCTVNPLKMSQPLGAALAFMGIKNTMPMLHGSQGCSSFGLVLLVRHFRESIPLQTTAMNEVATVLGGFENVEQAVVNIWKRTHPDVIGICSTGVTEIKGDDVHGFIRMIRNNHPELAELKIIHVSTPDFKGAFQDGWESAVACLVEALVEAPDDGEGFDYHRINVLPGSHLTPGDLDELRDIIEAFGLVPSFLPDLAGSLDGHVPDDFTPTTFGGISVEEIKAMGCAGASIAVGEQMRNAAVVLEAKTGTPYRVFDRLTGLEANDALMEFLSEYSGRPVPTKYRRQRSQLVDAILDGHFFFGGKKVAIGAEPDLLIALTHFLHEMGCNIVAAVTTTHSSLLDQIPAAEVLIGDLEDLETRAGDCDLLITHAHGRQAAERLGCAFLRIGLPIFDRLGAAHLITVGYRGTRDMIFNLGNMFISQQHGATPDDWRVQRMNGDATILAY